MSEAKIDNRSLVNVFKGITPSASGYDTPPSSLGNATDDDPTTATGEGVKATTAYASFGPIIIDLGSPKRLLVGARLGLHTDAGSILAYIDSSLDGNSYSANGGAVSSLNVRSETVVGTNTAIVYARYVRYQFSTTNSTNAYVKPYELYGYII